MALAINKNSRAKEIIRCGKDPIYFINNYIRIQHPTRGNIPFETYPFQDDCIQSFRDNRHNVVLKARQLGLSTIVSAYVTWHCLFKPDSNILVIATKLDVAKNFINKCKYAIMSLPPWMREIQKIDIFTQEIKTSMGSVIRALPSSPDAGRSEAASLLVVDEAAHIKDMAEIWKSVWPTLSTGGRSILLSTPKGTGNVFFKVCSDAESGKNNFNLVNLPWNVHPDRDQDWFDEETRSMNDKEIAQELKCSFLGSGDTFIAANILERIRNDIREPKLRFGFDRQIWMWEEPKPDHKYIISADTARGDGKDFSSFHVIDSTVGEVVMEYVGKAPPDTLAEMSAEQGIKYNEAVICPENNSYGYATIQRLVKLEYPKIYDSAQKNINIWSAIYTKNTSGTNAKNPMGTLGIFTSGQSRNNMLTKMEEVLRNGQLKIYSNRFYNELQTFVYISSNKVAAEKGKNDDLVLSFAIGTWLFEAGGDEQLSSEKTLSLLNAMTTTKSNSEEIIPDNPALVGDSCVFMPVAAGASSKSHPAMSNVQNIKPRIVHPDWAWLLK